MSLWILEIEFDNILGHSGLDSGRIEKPSFPRIFIGGSTWVV